MSDEPSSPATTYVTPRPGPSAAVRAAACAGVGSVLCAAAFAGAGAGHLGLMAALGAAAGLAVALGARDGAAAMGGVLAGMLAALVLSGAGLAAALVVGVFASVLITGVAAGLRRTGFVWRLERPRDLAWLLLAASFFALAAAGGFAGIEAEFGPTPFAPASQEGGAAIDAGVALLAFVLAAWPALTVSAADAPPSGLRLALALVLAVATLAAAAFPALRPQGDPLMLAGWFAVPGLLFATFALAGPALASLTLALSALVVAQVSVEAGGPLPALALCVVPCTAALLLAAHARRAASAWREHRWDWALDGSRLGVADWQLAPGSGAAFVSAAWRSVTGYTRPDWSPEAWVEQAHADDRTALRTALARVSSGETGSHRLELRMPQGDSWRWVEATLLVMDRDPAGRPRHLLATVLDVDDRHDAFERQRLSGSLFQHLHEGLLITDAELRVLDANPAYTQILGVPRHEVLGTVPSLLRPAPADPLARQQRASMWTSLRDTGGWRGELLERRRNGEACTLQVTISSVQGPQGDVRHHVLVITDVTEQRAQRERLERQALYDELTRLPNRMQLSRLLDDAMRASERDGHLLIVCYLDLDRFKPVNDRWGHAAGDRLLVELAGRLRGALRTRESWADTAARWR